MKYCWLLAYVGIGVASWSGCIAGNWDTRIGPLYAPPSLESIAGLCGTDIFGRSVLFKVIKGTEVALFVGFVTAMVSIFIGTLLGAIAGFFGGLLDASILWCMTVLSSIPHIMLLVAISFLLQRGLFAMIIALSVTSWVSLARMVRTYVLQQKVHEYVLAAQSLGASRLRLLCVHILPGAFPMLAVFFITACISAIKQEVVLSFLGLGVQGYPSWGIMIDDAKNELLRGVWWQFLAATIALFGIVLNLSSLSEKKT